MVYPFFVVFAPWQPHLEVHHFSVRRYIGAHRNVRSVCCETSEADYKITKGDFLTTWSSEEGSRGRFLETLLIVVGSRALPAVVSLILDASDTGPPNIELVMEPK
jgi:hypothetical protein